MKATLIAACAAGLVASSAVAQASPPPENSSPASSAGTMGAKSDPMGAKAETGAAVNTAATASDLRVGASVSDAAGAELGTISKVTHGKSGADTMVTLSAKGKTKSIPASSLSVSHGALTSSETATEVWGPK